MGCQTWAWTLPFQVIFCIWFVESILLFIYDFSYLIDVCVSLSILLC